MTNKAGEQPTITQADYDIANKANVLWGQAINGPHVAVLAASMSRVATEARTTSLAAQDGLVEALEKVQKLIGDAFEQIAPLKRQGEDRIWQPASTACVMLWEARDRIAALAAIKGDKS